MNHDNLLNVTQGLRNGFSLQKVINFGISGDDIPEAAERRENRVPPDVTKVHSQGIHAVDAFEPETIRALDSGIRNTGRPKRKELEKRIYVHLSEDNSNPKLMAHKNIQVSRSPATIDHIDKVQISSIPNVHSCKCGLIFDIDGLFKSILL